MSTYVVVVISPATQASPVVTSVSQATRARGSSARIASRTASEIWSATLSGCPSVTDSDVKRLRSATAGSRLRNGEVGGHRSAGGGTPRHVRAGLRAEHPGARAGRVAERGARPAPERRLGGGRRRRGERGLRGPRGALRAHPPYEALEERHGARGDRQLA